MTFGWVTASRTSIHCLNKRSQSAWRVNHAGGRQGTCRKPKRRNVLINTRSAPECAWQPVGRWVFYGVRCHHNELPTSARGAVWSRVTPQTPGTLDQQVHGCDVRNDEIEI